MNRRRLKYLMLAVLAGIVALFVYAAWPGSSTFTISPETTYITKPLDADGYPDYVTALNERLRGAITPESNANVLIWQALGPHPEGATMPPEYFQWLGYQPPEEGEYFVPFNMFLSDRLKEKYQERREELNDRQERAAKWPWTETEELELAGWLARNEKPLAMVSKVVCRTEYYNPVVFRQSEHPNDSLISASLSNVFECRQLVKALACRGMMRLGKGQIDEAWQDLLTCHRLGRLIARGASLQEMLVGVALDRVASIAVASYLDRAPLSSDQINRCQKEFEQLPAGPVAADKIDLHERFELLQVIMQLAKYGPDAFDKTPGPVASPSPHQRLLEKLFTRSIDWDPALRNTNEACDRAAATMRKTDRTTRNAELKVLDQEFSDKKTAGLTQGGLLQTISMRPKERGELIGLILFGMALPAFEKMPQVADRCQQYHNNTRIAFALAAYHCDHGRYPAKLDELSPKYIEQIPDDLFSGKPLTYRAEGKGYLLYSVGQNGIDDGGRTFEDVPRGDDIVIRMPAPEPKNKKQD
jgi:hypothetical protein